MREIRCPKQRRHAAASAVIQVLGISTTEHIISNFRFTHLCSIQAVLGVSTSLCAEL